MSVWSGTLPGLLAGDIPEADEWAEITGALAALTGAWTDYSATLAWTAASVNPAIVNGAINARYIRAGKLVGYTGRILMGSGTTYGTGEWYVSTPIAARDTALFAGAAIVYDDSTAGNRKSAGCWFQDANRLRFYGDTGTFSSTSPFTWASVDRFIWAILYETA